MKLSTVIVLLLMSSVAFSQAETPSSFDLALEAFQNGDPREAVRLWSVIIEDPDSTIDDRVLALQNRASAHFVAGNTEKAIGDFSEALRFRTTAELFSGRGAAYSRAGEVEAAVRDFSTAIQLKPDFAIAYYNRGNLMMDGGDLKGAISDYTEALKINEDFVSAHLRLGACFERAGEFNRALRHYERAIQLEQSVIAYLRRGNLYMDTGKPEAAIDDFTHVIAERPEWGYRSRAGAFLRVGRYESAVEDLTMALKTGTPEASFFADRGNAYAVLGMDQKALDDFNRALELDPLDRLLHDRGILRLPPIFDHGSADLRWNLRPCVSSPEGLRVAPAIKPSRSRARPRRGGPKGRGRSVATA